ncbi:MAG: helix-turn-helix domain-containing protein [Bacteroidetes bacterium]|nr:helix-turn-helix domain-containing protein [Bacteroidota bacterium]
MSHSLAQNIKYLRKERGYTQGELAGKLGINRAALASYEEGRAEPRLAVLQMVAGHFSCSLDDLLHLDFSRDKQRVRPDKSGKSLRVLSVAVDAEEKEKIVVVPVKAAAGYLDGFSDVDYIESLPSFSLPLQELGKERSYRLFQIKGDSMNPIPSGSYIISEYVQDWNQIKDDRCYILITQDEGIVYKRVLNRLHEEQLILKSDNPEYKPYSIGSEMIAEVWKAIGYISLQLPESGGEPLAASQIMNALIRLEKEVKEVKERVQKY